MTPFVSQTNYLIKFIWSNFKVKIVGLTVELYFKGKNLNSQFSPILSGINDFSIKQNVSIGFSSIVFAI